MNIVTIAIIILCFLIFFTIRATKALDRVILWMTLLENQNRELLKQSKFEPFNEDGFGTHLIPEVWVMTLCFWVRDFDKFLSAKARKRIYG